MPLTEKEKKAMNVFTIFLWIVFAYLCFNILIEAFSFILAMRTLSVLNLWMLLSISGATFTLSLIAMIFVLRKKEEYVISLFILTFVLSCVMLGWTIANVVAQFLIGNMWITIIGNWVSIAGLFITQILLIVLMGEVSGHLTVVSF